MPVFDRQATLSRSFLSELTRQFSSASFPRYQGDRNHRLQSGNPSVHLRKFVDVSEADKANKMQAHIVETRQIAHRGFATVGIIALVGRSHGLPSGPGLKALQASSTSSCRRKRASGPRPGNDFFEAIFKMKWPSWGARRTREKAKRSRALHQQLRV